MYRPISGDFKNQAVLS